MPNSPPADTSARPETGKSAAYEVLARKYRPQTFDDLIGQESMVRTLSNAFASDRIAHGFILTGVRGVGKTTTARIIAKGLNCVGPDGSGGPTVKPCGQCDFCTAIAESRHVDVLEMDAASRTGIDDIREIIESVRYRPAAARFKVYIVDEVHMLSKQAFNGLLKTLEEPPPHVKFIFATTEIRKVPVTVLSRCQRFDLRRIGTDRLIAHLAEIAKAEGAEAEEGALALLARAGEGSARDALSLLDQAIAHGARSAEGTVRIAEAEVRDMLGLADRARIIDLFEKVMAGDTPGALEELRDQYDTGADPLVVLTDLLELTHWLTRLKVVPSAAADAAMSESERTRGQGLSEALAMPVLTRAWQMLLKGVQEAQSAPHALGAAEMVLIRLAYAATLQTPEELLKALDAASSGTSTPGGAAPRPASRRSEARANRAEPPPPRASRRSQGSSAPALSPRAELAAPAEAQAGLPELARFEDLVALADEHRDIGLKLALEDHVHVIRFEPGRLECRLDAAAPPGLVKRMREALTGWTGRSWIITLANAGGAPTLSEQAKAARNAALAEISAEPLVKSVLDAFPGGKFGEITETAAPVPGEEENADTDESDDEDS